MCRFERGSKEMGEGEREEVNGCGVENNTLSTFHCKGHPDEDSRKACCYGCLYINDRIIANLVHHLFHF